MAPFESALARTLGSNMIFELKMSDLANDFMAYF
jgi:hypothetical protein